jgi:SAM-dependent methyltransferase
MSRSKKTDLVDKGSQQHYRDADLYDFEYRRRRDDVRFYADLAEERLPVAGQVLELCCGSGRVTREILKRDRRVVAMDLSQEMLVRARRRLRNLSREKRENALFFRGDIRRFALNRKFSLIVMAFNSFEHLYTRTEVAACLEEVKRHLSPDGIFAFDLQLPDLRWLTKDPRKRWARTRFRHPRTGQLLEYTTNHTYDPISQIALIRLFYEPLEPGPLERPHTIHLSQRKFFPAELEALLAHSGFGIEARFADFDGHPLDEYAENQVLLCRSR